MPFPGGEIRGWNMYRIWRTGLRLELLALRHFRPDFFHEPVQIECRFGLFEVRAAIHGECSFWRLHAEGSVAPIAWSSRMGRLSSAILLSKTNINSPVSRERWR